MQGKEHTYNQAARTLVGLGLCNAPPAESDMGFSFLWFSVLCTVDGLEVPPVNTQTHKECLCSAQQKTLCYVSTATLITIALNKTPKQITVNWIQPQKSWLWVVYKWSGKKKSSLWFFNLTHMVLQRHIVYVQISHIEFLRKTRLLSVDLNFLNENLNIHWCYFGVFGKVCFFPLLLSIKATGKMRNTLLQGFFLLGKDDWQDHLLEI